MATMVSANPFDSGWQDQANRPMVSLCNWTRPATEYREAKTFENAGFLKDGKCIPFGSSSKTKKKQVINSIPSQPTIPPVIQPPKPDPKPDTQCYYKVVTEWKTKKECKMICGEKVCKTIKYKVEKKIKVCKNI